MTRQPWRTTPVIVVGINRSGTKWLSNEIAAHSQAACIQADVHGGIVESNLLTEFGRGFDLSSDVEYERFLEFWQRTHFFHLANGDRDWLRSLDPRPANSVEALRYLMELVATRGGKNFWVQKVSPRDAEATLDVLTDARVVVIKRQAVDTVRSKVRLDARNGLKTHPLRAGMSQGMQNRKLNRVLRRPDVKLVRYESLVADRSETMSEIFQFIGLDPVDSSSEFKPNTSFANQSDRKATIGKSGEIVARLAVGLCRIIPLVLLEPMQRVFSRGRPEIIPGTFVHEEV